MKLSALEIRKHEFSRTFRGCDPEEVDAFLDMVSRQWEELDDERRRMQDRTRELEAKLQHYQKVEEALQQALQTARETSENAIRNAEEKASLIVQQAEARADDIKRNAEQERTQMKQDTARLTGRRKEVAARLRAFLMSEMELLAHFESDDPVGFIKLMPSDQGMRLAMQAGPSSDEARTETEPLQSEPYAPDSSAGAASASTDEAPADESATVAPAEASAPPEGSPSARGDAGSEYPEFSEQTHGDHVAAPPREPRETPAPAPEEQPKGDGPAEEPTAEQPDAEQPAKGDGPAEKPNVEQPAKKDEVRSGPGWIVHPVVSRPADEPRRTGSAQRSVAGSSSEIEKIRRILNDLD